MSAGPSVIAGKYVVQGVLGRGGMAIVYSAIHVATERRVALKRPISGALTDSVTQQRFEREARAAGRIRSEHVVEVLDVDHDADGPYLVMEHLEGESLAARLDREKALAPDATLRLVDQLLAGAGAAHRAGVIHRDLKPANVFFERSDDGPEIVKILDFGISKIRGKHITLTEPGAVMGTVGYLSPEQIEGEGDNHRSDLWAIGVITFRCLAGFNPFEGGETVAVFARILQTDAPELPASVPEHVRSAFRPFLRGTLARKEGERFASAEEARGVLLKVAEDLYGGISVLERRGRRSPRPSMRWREALGPRPDLATVGIALGLALALGVWVGLPSAQGPTAHLVLHMGATGATGTQAPQAPSADPRPPPPAAETLPPATDPPESASRPRPRFVPHAATARPSAAVSAPASSALKPIARPPY